MLTDNFSCAEELIDTLFPLRKTSYTHGKKEIEYKKANGEFETSQESECLK